MNHSGPPPPSAGPASASDAAVSAPGVRECGICQSPINPLDATFICPSCQLVYHAECWQSNLGCASYGCNQVNALAHPADGLELLDDREPEGSSADSAPADPGSIQIIPWPFVLLAAAGLSLLISPMTWGIASALTLAGIGWRISKVRNWRDPVLMIAVAICLIGIIAGLLLAPLWWGIHNHD